MPVSDCIAFEVLNRELHVATATAAGAGAAVAVVLVPAKVHPLLTLGNQKRANAAGQLGVCARCSSAALHMCVCVSMSVRVAALCSKRAQSIRLSGIWGGALSLQADATQKKRARQPA